MRKERALDETELASVDANGLYTLSDFLPKRPGEEELNAISEMFQASVDGELYDVERWGNFYKPYGVDAPANSSAKPATTPPAQPVAETKAPEVTNEPKAEAPAPAPATEEAPATAPAEASGEKPSADDILNMIRNRS